MTRSFLIGLSDRIEISNISRNSKRKDEFVNQTHPAKIVKIKAFFVFEFFFVFKSEIVILVFDNTHESLLITITFFN